MKVLLINGSPNPDGCTNRALREVENTLREEGLETRIFQIGNRPVRGCNGCNACEKLGRCVHEDDAANEMLRLMTEADGIVVGTPVYYSGANGALCALLDRIFYAGGSRLTGKPAAAVVSARRSGTTAAYQRLNQYFAIKQMPIVTSQYWNNVHGYTPGDVEQDLEGLQTMRTLGKNMAWMLKLIQSGQSAGLPFPEGEKLIYTDFIR
ncbi:MAG: flavodoxin family protein [Oscillospiraceae bacterium]|nr:flavodoxin family protein [Oscillospiraceae bacterium]